jgi:CO/xanthine dehydrogenase FAD-binding subunit
MMAGRGKLLAFANACLQGHKPISSIIYPTAVQGDQMPAQPGAYYRPETLAEALRLLAEPDVVPLAGGTALLAGGAPAAPAGVVDLQALGLNQLKWVETGKSSFKHLFIGATAKLIDVAEFMQAYDEDSPAPLLQNAIRRAGPNTYRNAATVGGVIAGRLPDSELLAALLVLDAELALRTPDVVLMPLVDYLSAAEQPKGLITHLTLPWTAGRGDSHRVARTPADYPIVSITCWQPYTGAPRLAATGIGERPLRLDDAEALLTNGLTSQTIELAATAAQAANRHPGDFRGDSAYRAEMAAVLTRRVLQETTAN